MKIHSTELIAAPGFPKPPNIGNGDGECNNFNTGSGGLFDIEVQDKQLVYRQQLIGELVENEKEFVLELQNLMTNFLEPLRQNGDM